MTVNPIYDPSLDKFMIANKIDLDAVYSILMPFGQFSWAIRGCTYESVNQNIEALELDHTDGVIFTIPVKSSYIDEYFELPSDQVYIFWVSCDSETIRRIISMRAFI